MESEPASLRVLVVEDDEDDFFIARRLLVRATGADVDWAQTYEEGLEAVLKSFYHVALVDYRLGSHNGVELLHAALARGCHTPFILLTGQDDRAVDLGAMTAGAADYLVKWEFDAPLLERSIRYARERERAQERIRTQATLLDKARDAISACDLDGRVIYWNKSAERLTGYTAEEVMGQVADDLLGGLDDARRKAAHRIVRKQGEWSGELRQKTKVGSEIVVESRWTLVRHGQAGKHSILVINTDVTERKRLESQMLRAQRMESIGRLVSGIAHDLGNLLVPILLGAKVLQERFTDDEQTQRTLAMIQQSGQRGADMVQQVLAFARGVQGDRVPLRLEQVIRDVETLIQEGFPKAVTVTIDLPEALWPVQGDATQIQQVIMNLCVNARDAMPEGGPLHLRAENCTVDPAMARMHLEAEPGAYVRISVIDTGTGIPPDVLDTIFEPFFTTKPVGKGTGLGLSTVYSIVKSHGGFVSVESEVGVGTSFHVFLPLVAEGESVRTEGPATDVRRGAGQGILVVDDEAFIRETARQILEGAGYRVLTASDGAQGLAVLADHGDEIVAVLTDLMMPEIDGVAMIRSLRGPYPDLPVVAVSGLDDAMAQQALEAGASRFLAKPFTAESLCAVLSDVLARAPSVE